jgi:hypothetical protein
VLYRILLTTAVAFAAASCGSSPMSERSGLSDMGKASDSSETRTGKKPETVLPFVLACSPVADGSIVRSARVSFDGAKVALHLDYQGSEQLLSFVSSEIGSITLSSINVSWPADQLSFAASLDHARVFAGHLKLADEVVALSCYKVVTAERDSDEFTLTCVPVSGEHAKVEDLQLVVIDVVLAWEDGGLEMIVNPTSESQIFDFERADGVSVSDREISATWKLEQATFKATSLDGSRFDGQLAYEGQSAIPLVCWKL